MLTTATPPPVSSSLHQETSVCEDHAPHGQDQLLEAMMDETKSFEDTEQKIRHKLDEMHRERQDSVVGAEVAVSSHMDFPFLKATFADSFVFKMGEKLFRQGYKKSAKGVLTFVGAKKEVKPAFIDA